MCGKPEILTLRQLSLQRIFHLYLVLFMQITQLFLIIAIAGLGIKVCNTNLKKEYDSKSLVVR